MTRSCLWLGWIEWQRSFSSQAGGGEGRRDFFWLSTLLTLTLLLALLLWGTREGVLHRFMDVSVGYLPDHGIPVWLVAEVDGIDNHGVTKAVKAQVKKAMGSGITLHSYRVLNDADLGLPTRPNTLPWQEGKLAPVTFDGWVVDDAHDPLWQAAPAGLTLTVVLNEQLFANHFHCDAYRAALAEIPPSIDLPPPAKKPVHPKKDCLANGILWLQATLGETPQLLPFSIRWQSRIPTMQPVAFLLPQSVYHAIKLRHYNQTLRYYPQAPGQAIDWVKSLIFWGNDDTQPLAVANCLGGQWQPTTQQIILREIRPLPEVQACAKTHGIALQQGEGDHLAIVETVSAHPITAVGDGNLQIPCEGLGPKYQRKFACTTGNIQVNKEQVLAGPGDDYALAYVHDPKKLFEMLKQLEAFPNPQANHRALFSIHPIYADALARFSFIVDTIALIKSLYEIFFLLFLTALAWAQIGLVIDHRRRSYGLLLVKGFTWLQIHAMVCIQITLSVLLASVIAWMLFLIPEMWLDTALQRLLANNDYQAHLLVSHLELLPLPFSEHVKIVFLAEGVCLLITSIQLGWLFLCHRNEPASLMSPAG